MNLTFQFKLHLSLEITSSINRNCETAQPGVFKYFGTLLIVDVVPMILKILWSLNNMVSDSKSREKISERLQNGHSKPLIGFVNNIYSLCAIILGDIVDFNPDLFVTIDKIDEMLNFAIFPFLDKIPVDFLWLNIKNLLSKMPKQMHCEKKEIKDKYCQLMAPLLGTVLVRLNSFLAECAHFDEEE